VQLLRQPTKNEKRKLVAGGLSDNRSEATSDTPGSIYSSQNAQNAAAPVTGVEQFAGGDLATKANAAAPHEMKGSEAQPARDSPPAPRPESWSGQKGSPLSGVSSWAEGEPQGSRKTWSPSVLGAFQSQVQQQLQSTYPSAQHRTSSEYPSQPLHSTAPAPGLSQSLDQRPGSLPMPSLPATQQQQRRSPETEGLLKTSALSSSVDAAISNVDKALYEMQNREMERLSNRLNAAERERKSVEEELAAEQRRRKTLEERIISLEDNMRLPPSSLSSSSPPSASMAVSSELKRKVEMLEKQVASLKQEKQIEEMKRLEVTPPVYQGIMDPSAQPTVLP
jgi:hypothetical protein